MSDPQQQRTPAPQEVPGDDDTTMTQDAAIVPADDGAGTAQQVDPGGYPHPPSHRVPATPAGPQPAAQGTSDRQADNPRPDRGSADPDD